MTVTVAHVNLARGFRGGERQTELLIRALAGTSLRQVLIARRGGVLARRMADAGIEIRAVAGSAFGILRATAGVDLLHVHEGRSVYLAYVRSLLSRTPYIVTRRVDNPIREHWLGHRAYRRAACVAAVATEVAHVVRRYDPAVRIAVVHSSSSGFTADPKRAAEIRARYSAGFLVGQIGALDNAQKGQAYTLEVARQLRESHPDVRFLLVGDGRDEATLKRSAADLPNVSFAGFVDNVGDYLAALDVFILPSNREGIGGILLDAMDRGLPVVASRVGGLADIVHDGENGISIERGSVSQLRDAILALKESPELRTKLGQAGREFAKGFTADIMASKYLDLYRSALGTLD